MAISSHAVPIARGTRLELLCCRELLDVSKKEGKKIIGRQMRMEDGGWEVTDGG